MPNEPLTGADVEELESLTELTQVRGWRVFKNLLTKHRQYCIEQSHKNTRSGDYRKAAEWLAKSDEPQTVQDLVHNRKQELTKRGEPR